MKVLRTRKLTAFTAFSAVILLSCAHISTNTYDATATPESTLQLAIDAAPNSTNPYKIFLKRGVYHEKLTITKPNIHLIGEDRENTIVEFDAISDTPNPEGGTYGTRGSFTIKITAPGFHAENLTFANTFDYLQNYRKPDTDPTKFRNPQGVAVMLDDASDKAVFRNCIIKGNQDTLFPNAGRSYFENCTISGHVDFIFGAGTAVFYKSDIISIDRGVAKNNGYVTAASTHINTPYGLVFIDSRLMKDSPNMKKGSVHLGRPWHPAADSTAVGHVAFIDTWMDDHISSEGWVQMSALNAKGDRIWFDPVRDARFFESGSKGPGASASRPQVPKDQLQRYTIDRIFNGWKP